jgi:hypothetical protein
MPRSLWVSSVGQLIRLRVERRRFLWSAAPCKVWEFTITGHHIDTSVLVPQSVLDGSDEHDEFEKVRHFQAELERSEYLLAIQRYLKDAA